MGLFDNLFGKKQDRKKNFEINITPNGIIVNEQTLTFPIALSSLKNIFGEPTTFKGETNTIYTWQDQGIFGYSKDGELISELDIQLMKVQENDFYPSQAFNGILKIDGIKYQDFIKITENDYLFKDYIIGDLNVHTRLTKEEPKQIWCIGADKIEKVVLTPEQKSKYEYKNIGTEKIEFTDFNFKLLVIEELMYNQEILKPKFDVYEFAKFYDKRDIDIDEEGYDIIPEVVEYFEKLEIDKNLVNKVTKLYQDGGNAIYLALCPFWSGEDDWFDIESYKDIEHFPDLKKMTLFGNDQSVFEELRGKGIDAERL